MKIDERDLRRHTIQGAFFLLGLFFLLILYICYLQSFGAEALAHHPLNARHAADDAEVVRGTIYDSGGKVLAESSKAGTRSYPYGEIAAPITGYIGERIGSTGIENHANGELLGKTANMERLGPVAQIFEADHGDNVRLTVDMRVQEAAFKAMNGRKGAVVVLDVASGAILAMVSCPSFNPALVEENWETLRNQNDGPLLNRALNGMYPPGSTIKPMIAAAALDTGKVNLHEIFHCTGVLDVGGGQTLHEAHGEVHGNVNLEQAIEESCNVTFGTLAMRLGGKNLSDAFDRFGFRKSISGDITGEAAHLPDFEKLGQGEIAQTGIGQGSLLVTPMEMALTACAYANHGVVMKPYLIDEVKTPGGTVVRAGNPEKWFTAMTPEEASLIDQFMEKVVTDGTGKAARIQGVRVTGKTGTAENPHGKDHAWFIGSADFKGRKIAFSIILENSGGGGTEAAPVARQIIESLM